jgi:Holliday junction resolvasome RuvABC DNA-binding subunit
LLIAEDDGSAVVQTHNVGKEFAQALVTDLRTERVRAPDAEQAARNARVIFGMHVHTVERIDTTTGAAA